MGEVMKAIIYGTVNEFLQENEVSMLEKECLSQLILFNALMNQGAKTSQALIFGRVEENKDHPVLIFANVQPYNLLICQVRAGGVKEAITVLADYILQNNIVFKGINANKVICDTFSIYYRLKRPECDFKEKMAMDVMELKKLPKLTLTRGITRIAKDTEAKQTAAWMVAFAGEALGEELLLSDMIIKAAKLIEENMLYVFETHEGNIVSMAAAARKLVNGVCVNYVYTPKEYRGKGYAAANMYQLSKKLLEKGNQFCTLYVDKKNPISNRVYKKIGYEIVEDQYDIRLVTNG
jgi:GNAT superfamily N-acetyltransferase